MKSLRIFFARPAPHIARTVQYLQTYGFSNIYAAPLSVPETLNIKIPPTATAFIFPSSLAVQPFLPKLPCVCVGQATAHAAATHGFSILCVGPSNADEMAVEILAHSIPPQHFIHLHGPNAKTTWHKKIISAGHHITSLQIYQLHTIDDFPLSAQQQLRTPPTHTLLFSVESTHLLLNLLQRANIPPAGTAIAFSPAVAEVAQTYWPRTLIATAPKLENVVDLLQQEATS